MKGGRDSEENSDGWLDSSAREAFARPVFFRVVGVILCLLVWSGRLRAETLTVATYNVENYVAADRMVDGVYRKEYPKSEAAKQALRATIRGMNADVIALQEMGPRPYLDELRRDLAHDGLDYPYAELLEAADPERHVAVLSRRPFKAVRRHVDLSFVYFGKKELVKRGLLEVRLATEGGELTLFVVHLKSRFTDRADDPLSAIRRAEEAEAVRERVLNIFPKPSEARFAILGDCNDVRASKPLRLLMQRGKTAIAEMLHAVDSRGEAWTHFYRKEDSYSRVDYVLVSPALNALIPAPVARIYDARETSVASDHRPVVATFVLGK